MQVEWSEDVQVPLVQCLIQWWLGQPTAGLLPGLPDWCWVGLVYQPNWWLLSVWTQCLMSCPSSVLLMIAACRTGWPGLGQSLLLLLGQICHLRPYLPQLAPVRCVGGGGIVPPSLVEISCISKQYQVPGQSGVGFLTGDWDGEQEGVLPNASVSSGPFWPFGCMRVWPSIWILTPD